MSEQKRLAVVAIKHSGMIIGDSKHSRRYRLYVKAWAVVLSCFIVLMVAVVGVVWLVHRHYRAGLTTSGQTVSKKPSVSAQALGLALSGNNAAAQQLLNTQITKTHNAVEESQLYVQKASLAYSNGDFAECVQFGQKAESLNPTAASANLIATGAQALGNKTLALQYYNLELGRLGSIGNTPDKQEIESNIKALGG
jgi:hypothetical protein